MNSIFKRITSFILCAVMTVFLCSCGEDDQSKKESEQPKEGSTSLFIYMCGSDLESQQGIASKAIKELLEAKVPDDMNIIIETGGAKKWRGLDISADVTERYQVKNGELILIERLDENMNMGDPATLTDFASWCDRSYRSERNMMILWDHGAGSARGVCFDEVHEYDGLTLTELGEALKNAELNDKYDILGFDACLMASFETAVTVKDYGDYLIASQDIEPSCGWGLKTVAETFCSETDAAETGKIICDDYIARCKDKNENDVTSTLSVFDLSKADELIDSFNKATAVFTDEGFKKKVVYAARNGEHFGGDASDGRYSNMIDLSDFFLTLGAINDDTLDLLACIELDFVKYYVNCNDVFRFNSGISFYYPCTYNAAEIDEYLGLDINDKYNYVIRELYTNIPETTIEFKDDGSVTEDDAFTVSLTPESAMYISTIDYVLMTEDERGRQMVITIDNDIHKDWDKLVFKSNFRGIRLAMDGHPFYTKTLGGTERFTNFSAPLKVNGGPASDYRFGFVWNEEEFNSGHYLQGGLWGGYDENGLPTKEIIPLENGDTVQLYAGYITENDRITMIPGDEFVISDSEEISEVPLDGKEYQYYFIVTDIFGNQFKSKLATFEMTKTYEELLENPLPDGEYAAKVIKVEPFASETTE